MQKKTPLIALFLICLYSFTTKKHSSNAALLKENTKEVVNDSIKKEVLTPLNDFVGEYELVQGKQAFIDGPDWEVYKGAIIIEKLSETDLGFYTTSKVKEISPVGSFGIVRRAGNKFYTIYIIPDKDIDYTDDSVKKGIFLHYPMKIEKRGDTLVVIKYTSNAREYLIFKKKKPQDDFHISLIKKLEKTKLMYENYLIAYKRAKNKHDNTLEIQYSPRKNDTLWRTIHKHKVEGENHCVSRLYSLYQNGQFLKEDSLFYERINELNIEGI